MSVPAIAAAGAYAPRLSIDAERVREALGRFDAPGVERTAVPEADEDALTMAAEAAGRALDAGGYRGADVAALWFATTTPPLEEEDLTARLSSVLGTSGAVRTRTLTGSTRAGAQALDAAVEAGPWGDGVAVVVAADCPRGAPDSAIEHAAGAGAASFVLDDDGPVEITDRSAYVDPYPGTRFRSAGSRETRSLGITQYDRDAFRTALGEAAAGLDDLGDVDAAAVQSPDGKLPTRATDALGVDQEAVAAAETVGELGDTGVASAPLGAVSALADGAERVLLAAYGSGAGANTLVLARDGPLPVDSVLEADTALTYPEYLRRRGTLSSGEPEGGGAYVSVPSWKRSLPQRHRLVAGRCPACGALNVPPGGACRDCSERPDGYESVELPGTGTVDAATTIAQGGAPPEFVEQQARSGPYISAIVSFDGPNGDRSVSVPVQMLEGPGESVQVGAAVETTVRRIYDQEGVVRYGIKARLAGTRG